MLLFISRLGAKQSEKFIGRGISVLLGSISGNNYNFASIVNPVANGRDKDGTIWEHLGEEMAADDLRKTPTESMYINSIDSIHLSSEGDTICKGILSAL